MPEPCTTVWLEGEADSEKSGGGLTTKVTMVVWLKLPLVPVMVTVELPVAVLLAVVTVMVVDPEPLTEAGLKVALAPTGSPVAVKPTVPLNPPDGVTVNV